MHRVRPILFVLICVWPCADSRAETLVFSDDFVEGNFDELWTHSTENLAVAGGRVAATENGRFLETTQKFGSELRRIEVDIEKEGDQNHSCWDFFVTLVEAPSHQVSNARAAILFDQDGIDAVGIDTMDDVCLNSTDFASVGGSAMNKGTATISIDDSQMHFSFTNGNGDVLNAPPSELSDFDSVGVRIQIAAFPDSPRYVDAVRIYAVPEPSTFALQSCTLVGLLTIIRQRGGRRSRKRPSAGYTSDHKNGR